MLAALLAWWRATVYMIEEAFGPHHWITKFFPIGRTPQEKSAPLVLPGLGEPGIKRGGKYHRPASVYFCDAAWLESHAILETAVCLLIHNPVPKML